MSLPTAMFAGRISLSDVLGLTEGAFLAKTLMIAKAKVSAEFTQAFILGIGCNWLVCLAVLRSYVSKDMRSKILAMWFPIIAFVAIGFQHVVANLFVIPAAIFADALSWGEFVENFCTVFLRNAVGGAIFVGLAYYVSYTKTAQASANGDDTLGIEQSLSQKI